MGSGLLGVEAEEEIGRLLPLLGRSFFLLLVVPQQLREHIHLAFKWRLIIYLLFSNQKVGTLRLDFVEGRK